MGQCRDRHCSRARHHPARPCGSAFARSRLSDSKSPQVAARVAGSGSVAVSSRGQSALRLTLTSTVRFLHLANRPSQSQAHWVPNLIARGVPSARGIGNRARGCRTPGRDSEGGQTMWMRPGALGRRARTCAPSFAVAVLSAAAAARLRPSLSLRFPPLWSAFGFKSAL
ncbi:hypothetical protein BJV74DRAFT_831480 [Russula compacta]|nr:hypothetical protein BJV74DRAFT_831480 [Russula compacta]